MINKIILGDCLQVLKDIPENSVDSVVTSPPYWAMRNYGTTGQLGLEKTVPEYIATMVKVFSLIRRVLKADGTLWLNLGDCYAASSYGTGGVGFESKTLP